LYTCHVLYGKDQLFQQATALGLLKLDTEITKSWGPRVLALAQAKPFVCFDFFPLILFSFRLISYPRFYLSALASCKGKLIGGEHGCPP
jgi:hypothetical protein